MSAELNDAELESILLNGDHDAARAVSVDISRNAGLTEEEIISILGERAVKYNPAQPRDERGRWTSLGGSSLLTQEFDEEGQPMAGIPLFDRLMYQEGVDRVDADTLQFYHGTTKQAWEKIKTEGLVPGGSPGADAWSERHGIINFMPLRIGDRAASAYVAIDFDQAINFATYAATIQKGDPLVLGVTLDRDDFVNVLVDEQGAQDWPLTLLRHVGTIPPSKIENLGSGMFGEDLGYRVEPLLDKSDSLTIYLVIVCEPSAEKYSPNQPRHPKGTPEGGQFMSTGGPVLRLGESARKYSPNQPRDERGRWTDSGINAAGMEVVREAAGQQANNIYIRRFMEAHGLTLEDYKAVNDLFYSHNQQHTAETDAKIREVWNSDTNQGRAMRLFADWNEWQVENVPRPPVNYDPALVMQRLDNVTDWSRQRTFFEDGNLYETKDAFANAMLARARGEWIFYRKGDLHSGVVSTTTNSRGAQSGGSRFVPTNAWTYRQLRDSGYRLIAGARGMIGITSADESEHLWLYTGTRKYNPNQPRDERGRWTDTIFSVANINATIDFLTSPTVVSIGVGALASAILSRITGGDVVSSEMAGYIAAALFAMNADRWDEAREDFTGALKELIALRLGKADEKDPVVRILDAILKEILLIDPAAELEKYSPSQPRDARGRWTTAYHGTSEAALESIMEHGLVVNPENRVWDPEEFSDDPDRAESVYVAKDLADAQRYAVVAAKAGIAYGEDTNPIVLEVSIPKSARRDFKLDEFDEGALRTSRTIPPEWIVKAYRVNIHVDDYDEMNTSIVGMEEIELGKAAGAATRFIVIMTGRYKKYDPNQPRDERGRWTSTGASAAIEQVISEGSTLAPIPEDISNWFGEYRVIREAGDIPGGVGEAIRAIPEEHLSLLHDTTISLNETVQASYYHPNRGYIEEEDVLGIYHPAQGTGDDSIQIAYRANGRDAKSISGTTLHEIGHAIDFKHGNRLGASAFNWLNYSMGLARYPMTDHEKQISAYYFKNTRERAAELYAMTYNPNFSAEGAFGLPAFRASELFGVASDRLRNTNLTNLNWESPDYLGLKN